MRSLTPATHVTGFAFLARATSKPRKAALFLFTLAVLLSGGAAALRGATLTVFSNADSGPGTLRQAIFDASSGDTINFAAGFSSIRLTSELVINKNLTVNGPGADKLSVQIADLPFSYFRVFRIAPTSVTTTISGVTISGPTIVMCCPLQSGGGVLNTGTLTIDNSTITGSATQRNGGGIANDGFLTITNSTISGNATTTDQSYGGGIANTGTLTIANSTVSGNATFSSSYGGGIANFNGGTLTITNSTVSGNSSGSSNCGGGIFTGAGSSATAHSTIIALNQGPSGLIFVAL